MPLPSIYWGSPGKPQPKGVAEFADEDDEEARPPRDVIEVLGFDPSEGEADAVPARKKRVHIHVHKNRRT